MKERPILVKGELVRAILDDRKTQTRRLVKGQALEWLKPDGFTPEFVASPENHMCPYGDPGDRLWVRETWGTATGLHSQRWKRGTVLYRCDVGIDIAGIEVDLMKWTPSIHMPRRASRIDLEIVEVRVQRLQDITEQDAREEGFDEWIPCNLITGLKGVRIGGGHRQATCREHFAVAWDAINGKRASWASNAWVWAISFKRVSP